MILDALAWLLSALPGALELLAGAAMDGVRARAREALAELQQAFTYGVLQ